MPKTNRTECSLMLTANRLCYPRFKIYNHKMAKDDLAAWACIRLDRLQQGYRFVTLLDTKGQETTGLLLVRVTKKLT